MFTIQLNVFLFKREENLLKNKTLTQKLKPVNSRKHTAACRNQWLSQLVPLTAADELISIVLLYIFYALPLCIKTDVCIDYISNIKTEEISKNHNFQCAANNKTAQSCHFHINTLREKQDSATEEKISIIDNHGFKMFGSNWSGLWISYICKVCNLIIHCRADWFFRWWISDTL